MHQFRAAGFALAVGLAFLAVAATASATSITSTTNGAPVTAPIHLVNEGGHVVLQNPIANVECGSTIESKVEAHGTGVTAAGNVTAWQWTNCTNNWHVTTSLLGSISVLWSGGHNGILRSNGARIDTTRFGVTCVYETTNQWTIGNVWGGSPATVTIDVEIPININLSSGLCGTSSAKWEGNYRTTSALYVIE